MIRALLFTSLVVAGLSAPSAARAAPGLCASAKTALDKDWNLAQATEAVFPRLPVVHRNDDCRYPLQVLRYGDADVLIAIGNTPGETCHGCAATMSAYVLRRLPGSFRVVARFERFAQEGTFGNPGRINGLQIAGHDAFAVESGAMFQGYASSGVTFYVFHDRRLVEAKPSVPLSASNAGAMANDTSSVEGAWHVTGSRSDAVVVDYAIDAHGHKHRASATWTLVNDALVRTAGHVPAELDGAAGR